MNPGLWVFMVVALALVFAGLLWGLAAGIKKSRYVYQWRSALMANISSTLERQLAEARGRIDDGQWSELQAIAHVAAFAQFSEQLWTAYGMVHFQEMYRARRPLDEFYRGSLLEGEGLLPTPAQVDEVAVSVWLR